MNHGLDAFLDEWSDWTGLVDRAREAKLYFYMRPIDSPQGPRIRAGGRDHLMFASNNYLGLANDPRVKAAAKAAVDAFGTGCCGTQLINGYSTLHARFEEEIAAFKRCASAVVFTTGYQANLGAISALVSEGDIVICDKLDHASIFDGARLSGAHLRLFNHNDMDKLRRILAGAGDFRRRLIVVDGVYSMDGDLADLPAICTLAREYDAVVMVDEAHATGVMGRNGRGTVEHFGLEGEVDVVMGTMSKALASVGGFVAGRRELTTFLKHRSRAFIFSAAQPPAAIAAARAALEIIASEPDRRAQLWHNTERFRSGLVRLGFDVGTSMTPIVPILLGRHAVEAVLRLVAALEADGLFLCAILPPAVRPDQVRLRAHVSSAHSEADIDEALHILAVAGRRLGLV